MSRKHPVKQSSANKEKLERDIINFLDVHKKEVQYRYDALVSKSVEVYFKIREDVMKAAESVLPKEVLDANLFDFINEEALRDDRLVQVSKEEDTAENFIDIATDAVAAFENLSIPVTKTSARDGHEEVETMRTPLQQNLAHSNLPSVIRPKIDDVRERHFRAAKGNEVAFSVDGSPIVVLPPTVDQSTLLVKQIIESEEDAFSPNSREVVSMFKSLMRRKMAEAESGDHPQELD